MTQSSSGGGSDTLRFYLCDSATDDPRSTMPVLTQPLVLTPGASDTTESTIEGDARVLDLFAQKQMRMTITTALHGPDAGAPLSGQLDIVGIDAVVVAGRKGL